MYRIKRTKTVYTVVGSETRESAAVHYATAVARGGNVTGWTPQEGDACPVSEDVARAVRDHYEGLPNVGELELEALEGTADRLAGLVTGGVGVSEEDFQKLQVAYRGLTEENAEMVRKLEASGNTCQYERERADNAEQRLADLDQHTAGQVSEITTLRQRVTDLEAELVELRAHRPADLFADGPARPAGRPSDAGGERTEPEPEPDEPHRKGKKKHPQGE